MKESQKTGNCAGIRAKLPASRGLGSRCRCCSEPGSFGLFPYKDEAKRITPFLAHKIATHVLIFATGANTLIGDPDDLFQKPAINPSQDAGQRCHRRATPVPPNKQMWCVTVEAEFSLLEVTEDRTKFDCALTALDPDTQGRVAGFFDGLSKVGTFSVQGVQEESASFFRVRRPALLRHVLQAEDRRRHLDQVAQRDARVIEAGCQCQEDPAVPVSFSPAVAGSRSR